jgi:hypothetical protein
MNEGKKELKTRISGAAKVVVIFLLGIGAGAGLIYALQPPKPPPPALIFSVFLFTSDEPIADFTPHAELMKQGVSAYLLGGKGPKYFCNTQLAAMPGVPTTFQSGMPGEGDSLSAATIRIDLVGKPLRDRFRTDLTTYMGSHRAAHPLDLQRNEIRAIDLGKAPKTGERLYALVQVEEIVVPPAGAVLLPNPVAAPAKSGGTGAPAP